MSRNYPHYHARSHQAREASVNITGLGYVSWTIHDSGKTRVVDIYREFAVLIDVHTIRFVRNSDLRFASDWSQPRQPDNNLLAALGLFSRTPYRLRVLSVGTDFISNATAERSGFRGGSLNAMDPERIASMIREKSCGSSVRSTRLGRLARKNEDKLGRTRVRLVDEELQSTTFTNDEGFPVSEVLEKPPGERPRRILKRNITSLLESRQPIIWMPKQLKHGLRLAESWVTLMISLGRRLTSQEPATAPTISTIEGVRAYAIMIGFDLVHPPYYGTTDTLFQYLKVSLNLTVASPSKNLQIILMNLSALVDNG